MVYNVTIIVSADKVQYIIRWCSCTNYVIFTFPKVYRTSVAKIVRCIVGIVAFFIVICWRVITFPANKFHELLKLNRNVHILIA